jgi:AraC-like DNA-binding protein
MRDRDLLIPLLFSKKEAPKVWQAYRDFIKFADKLKDIVYVDKNRYSKTGLPWRLEIALIRLISELAAFGKSLDLQPEDGRLLKVPANKDPRLLKLCYYIRSNPSFPWNIPKLAQHIGLTVRHLERLCKTSLGQSLKSYIVAARLQYAQTILDEPQKEKLQSIKEISYMCGYSSQQLFSSEYKKFFGVSPLKARTLSKIVDKK